MPRKPRILKDDSYYHLIARGNNRLLVLGGVENGFKVFKDLIFESRHRFDWKLNHYCLMGNHVHLLGWLREGKQLPRLMQYLLFQYSQWYRKQTGYTGHLWQGRYKSPVIEKESYFLECGRYIERNPLRAKVVKQVEDYPWSSYRYYAFGGSDFLIDADPYYEYLGSNAEIRQERYREFVKLDGPYDKLVDQSLLEAYF